MRRLFRRLACRWYGHNWVLGGTPCQRACLDDICFRCNVTRPLHASDPRYCSHPLERNPPHDERAPS